MNDILWKVMYKDGTIVQEQQDNGKYNLFTKLNKENIIYFFITNKKNNITYSINLKNGDLLVNGVIINQSIQIDKKNEKIKPLNQLNKSLFWYNQCISQIGSNNIEFANVFFGYNAQVNIPYNYKQLIGRISKIKLLCSINSNNNSFSISLTKTFNYIINGEEKIIQL